MLAKNQGVFISGSLHASMSNDGGGDLGRLIYTDFIFVEALDVISGSMNGW